MSSVTAFNYRAFACDLERDTQLTKRAVSLSAMTSEEMARLAVVEVRTPIGRENRAQPWVPCSSRDGTEMPTFWDARMGNFDVKGMPTRKCETCQDAAGGRSKTNERCVGHYGFVSMPRVGDLGGAMPVYNPLLFKDLVVLLRAQCFVCTSFRAPAADCARWEMALTLFDAGLVAEALGFLSTFRSGRGSGAFAGTGGKRAREEDAAAAEEQKEEEAQPVTTRQPAAAGGEAGDLIASMRSYVAQRIRAAEASAALPTDEAERRRVLSGVADVRTNLCMEALRELADHNRCCSRCGAESPQMTEKDGQLYFKYSAATLDRLVSGGMITLGARDEWAAEMRIMRRQRVLLQTPVGLKHTEALCARHGDLLGLLMRNVGSATVAVEFNKPLPPERLYRAFFIDRVLVPPVSARIAAGTRCERGALQADDRTATLNDILKFSQEIEHYHTMKAAGAVTDRQMAANETNMRCLQQHVDKAYEDVLGSFAKKEGLFRMNMMGKRVNQACRSVISPDFTVEPNEILLPRPFARGLSYPERVTFYDPRRAALLRQCIVNGPTVYPGASHVEVHRPSGAVESIDLAAQSEEGRERIADAHIALARNNSHVVVYRHVLDGDRIVFNRQPTLHRPSMQGYEVRVLSNLKTIRFHYVNGKSYNADFDGDEMNVHVPQSLACRAELDVIMDANMNFLAPTSGRPIRGLIQDHCIAGVLLTIRDRFFDRETFIQLVYSGLEPYLGESHDVARWIPPPTIFKPKTLWTGKQVVSSVLRFVTNMASASASAARGETCFSVGVTAKGSSQVYQSKWSTHDGSRVADHPMADDPVVVLNSELLVGVLDKAQLGPSHLAVPHVLMEVYGPHATGKFFGIIGRVLTYALRYDGLSLGVEDMLLNDHESLSRALRDLDLCALKLTEEGEAIGLLSKKASATHNAQLPCKLRVPFPRNDLVGMTQTGAKGSNTNAIQMAVMLGQQTFDGRRIAPMTSNKTMPSFFPGDKRARAFGFAMGRFVSGIRPAEYTIHAMAGRDGLIDTGIKTARSGYLQRCLIKGLESLTVHWDGTVRDSGGALVQLRFGGDGLDPTKASTLTSWDMLDRNIHDMATRFDSKTAAAIRTSSSGGAGGDEASPDGKVKTARQEKAAVDSSSDEDGGNPALLRGPAAGPWQRQMREAEAAAPLPQHLQASLDSAKLAPMQRPKAMLRWRKKGVEQDRVAQDRAYRQSLMTAVTKARIARAQAEPGDAVGIVAAQAAGEPSTQMTLNTFHQAGATVSHVTEGIPRLRELLMYASVANAAVIVPVRSLANGELDLIHRIHDSVRPTPLKDVAAAVERPFRWAVERGHNGAIVRVAVLLSRTALTQHAAALGLPRGRHVLLLADALKRFGKALCTALRGRGEAGTSAGKVPAAGVHQAVVDPSALLPEEKMHDDARRQQLADDEDSDDAAEHDNREAPAAAENDNDSPDSDEDGRPSSATPRPAREAVESSGDDSDEDDEDSIPLAQRAAPLLAAKKRQQQVAKAAAQDEAARRQIDYDQFPQIDGDYAAGSMHLRVAPVAAAELLPAGADAAAFIGVDVSIRMPSSIVAVVPDMVRRALKSTLLTGDGPVIEKVQWLPDARGDRGELVFQGEGASLRTVLALLGPHAAMYPGVDLHATTSTDFRDVEKTFGIEAAYQCLLKELSKLFARHSVDERHLSLMADVATRRGTWQAFNFNGVIAHAPSPLFQMTFASSRKFLEQAIGRGVPDDLSSFSAAIMVGEKPQVGTATVTARPAPEALQGAQGISGSLSQDAITFGNAGSLRGPIASTAVAELKERRSAELKPMKTAVPETQTPAEAVDAAMDSLFAEP